MMWLLVRWRRCEQLLDEYPQQQGPVTQSVDEHVLVLGVRSSADCSEPVEGRHPEAGREVAVRGATDGRPGQLGQPNSCGDRLRPLEERQRRRLLQGGPVDASVDLHLGT